MSEHFELLSDENIQLTKSFSCLSDTSGLKSKERRRVIKHDKEIENFLKNEALPEQKRLLNTTHLLISEKNAIIGFVSLCNDVIRLSIDKRKKYNMTYYVAPAVKIARLGVAKEFQHMGYGKYLLKFSLYKAIQMNDISGVAFITLDCYSHRKNFYLKEGFSFSDEQPDQREYDTPISLYKHILTWLDELN